MEEWVSKRIKIHTVFGWQSIDAYVKNGLAVHSSLDTACRWVISKTSSGQKLTGGLMFLYLESAKACADELLRLFDWKKPGHALRKEEDLGEKVKACLKRFVDAEQIKESNTAKRVKPNDTP